MNDGATESRFKPEGECGKLSEDAKAEQVQLIHPLKTKAGVTQQNGSNLLRVSNDSSERVGTEKVTFTLVYNKTKHKIEWSLDDKVSSLKLHIHSLTKVPPPMQKLMYRGMLKDTKTLRESGVTNGIKMMVIGSNYADVMSVDKVEKDPLPSEASSSTDGESFCTQKPHAKIIEKGVPDDAMPGYVNGHEVLPSFPLKGLVNSKGNKQHLRQISLKLAKNMSGAKAKATSEFSTWPLFGAGNSYVFQSHDHVVHYGAVSPPCAIVWVRLTFKLESDELWIGTKERTEKLPLTSIKNVKGVKIDTHPEYHILGLQLGPTERSRYWVYWVPSQYVEAIKDAILGGWKAF